MPQKYHKGDHVKVIKKLPKSMSHFQSDCEAIIEGSYADQFGGNDTNNYSIFIKDHGGVSWYQEEVLELIEKGRLDLLEKWQNDLKRDDEMKSNLDWIFRHGEGVLKEASGATVGALGKCLGINDLWGPRGEGFTYFNNAIGILNVAKEYLLAGDKQGWLDFCKEIKNAKEKRD